MCVKDPRVNTGDPPPCAGERPRNRRSVRIRAGRGWKSEGPIPAVKRGTIVEPRGLRSRVKSEGARARAIGVSLATSMTRSAVPDGLSCPSEPGHGLWVPWVGESIRHLVRKPDALCGLSPYVASSPAAPGVVGVSQPLRHITKGLQ